MAASAKNVPTTVSPPTGWPRWARRLASVAILAQLASVLAALLAQPPSSPIERKARDLFERYYELTDQGYSHRYYSDIEPTPILIAELHFDDARPNLTLRIPDRGTRPRMRYQRHLALAHFITQQARSYPRSPAELAEDPWARSYARHLCLTHPGCSSVTLRIQDHIFPDVEQLLAEGRKGTLNVDADEYYTTPQRIGDFPCPPR